MHFFAISFDNVLHLFARFFFLEKSAFIYIFFVTLSRRALLRRMRLAIRQTYRKDVVLTFYLRLVRISQIQIPAAR